MNQQLLIKHIMMFNHGVRTRNFAPLLELFAEDAELIFEGIPAGPFKGKSAIAAAYAANPPTDEIKLLRAWEEDGLMIADYAWRSSPYDYGGQMVIAYEGDSITSLMMIYQ